MLKLIKYISPVVIMDPRNSTGKARDMDFLTWSLQLNDSMCYCWYVLSRPFLPMTENKDWEVRMVWYTQFSSIVKYLIIIVTNINKLKLLELHLASNKALQKKQTCSLFHLHPFHNDFIYNFFAKRINYSWACNQLGERRIVIRGHSFITFAKFSEILTFHTPW